MPRKSRLTWSLDPVDVRCSWSTTRRCARRSASASRALDVSDATLTLRHATTGVEVAGSIPMDHYTRDQLRQLKDELERRLLVELEQRVARHLRIPGR